MGVKKEINMKKGKEKKKDAQGEFKGLPQRSGLAKKAAEYLDLKDEMARDKKNMEGCVDELVVLFVKEDKDQIIIQGRVVKYKHVVKDQITVLDMTN